MLSLSHVFLHIYTSKDEKLRIPVNVDGLFLTKPVNELYREHQLLPVPFMTGINDDEGGWSLPDVSVDAND